MTGHRCDHAATNEEGSMAKPYKDAHDLLFAGMGTAAKYHDDWQATCADLDKLVVATGFDPKGKRTPELIRAKVAAGASEAIALREGAKAPATDAGAIADASKKRALTLKTLRHLYYYESFGKQRIWILSLPNKLRGYPMEFASMAQPAIERVLESSDEKFDAKEMKDISEAAQMALAWIQKAMVVLGSSGDLDSRKLIKRWFVPGGSAGEVAKISDVVQTLRPHLQKIASGLKTGSIILLDSPHERGSGSGLEKSEAFVFTKNDLMVVHVESAFFSNQNTLTGKTNWARILVHELTHLYAKTADHSYSWQGLLPRDGDTLKKGNDKAVVAAPGFPAVRTLTFQECKENADTWAFFIADCASALSDRDRIQALGQRLYDFSGETMETPLSDKMKLRAGMK
jgi:hypothetical protein